LLGFVVLLGFLLRLYEINTPPVDFLSWRDTQTRMVARNFYREGMNLFSPSVDWRTTDEVAPKGTVGGTELMVVPYLTAMLYHLFGIDFWVGRVVPILFALLGAVIFHRLVKRFYGSLCATVATLLLTVSPYFLYCGRCHMPEPFAFAVSFAALYYYDRWLASGDWRTYFAAAAGSLLMLLAKPQLGVMIIPMAFLTFNRFGLRAFTQGGLYLLAALVGVPFLAYLYWTSVVLIGRTGLSFSGPGFFDFKRWLSDPTYYGRIAQSVWLWSVTPTVCVLGLIGLLRPARDRRDYFAHAWLAGALSLFFLMPGGTAPNGYYQLILEPPFALLAARTFEWSFRRQWVNVVAVGILAAAVVFSLQVAKRTLIHHHESEYRCGEWLREHTAENALVLTSTASPATLYFADRVGWTSWQERYGQGAVFGTDLINKVLPLGASILAIPEEWFDNAYHGQYNEVRDMLYDTFPCQKGPGFTVFDLTQPADLSLPVDGYVTFGLRDSRKYLRGTWGPDQLDAAKAPFASLGPGSTAQIRFAAESKPKSILLSLACAAPEMTITWKVNDVWLGSAEIPMAGRRFNLTLEDANLPDPDEHGRYTISFGVNKWNQDGVSVILHTMQVIP